MRKIKSTFVFFLTKSEWIRCDNDLDNGKIVSILLQRLFCEIKSLLHKHCLVPWTELSFTVTYCSTQNVQQMIKNNSDENKSLTAFQYS